MSLISVIVTIASGDPVIKEDTRGPAACMAPSGVALTPEPEPVPGKIQPLQYPATAPCSGVWGWRAILGLLLLGICAGATRCLCTG